MFIDKAKVKLQAGKGGNGCVSFRREKFVPLGGPDGGNGGAGGSIFFQADKNITTLLDFKYQPIYRAKRGIHGKGKKQHGKKGEDFIVKVPLGTIVREGEDGPILYDFVTEEEKVLIAQGGKGGRGNTCFLSNTQRAPRIGEDGLEGEEKEIFLELKVLADVGLVGCPNAGKSTLISHISNANSKVAAYPFTTLSPHLGVVKVGVYKSFVIADIPGLIEGAHKNVGLGHEFLKHIERTSILLFVLDIAATEGRDPLQDYFSLKEELKLHNESLTKKKKLIAANKIDLSESEEKLNLFLEKMREEKEEKTKVIPISAVTGEGLKELVQALNRLIEENKE
ncbi:GTPase ObgE [Candidatus Auribacterota bacterium]